MLHVAWFEELCMEPKLLYDLREAATAAQVDGRDRAMRG